MEQSEAGMFQIPSSKTLSALALAVSLLFIAACTKNGGNSIGVLPHAPAPARTPFYVVRNLGSLGGKSCCVVISDNDRGWVDFTSDLAGDKSFHPVLWIKGVMKDLGTLGGPNSSVGGMNDEGDVTVGGSDTGKPDPLGEDFCTWGTHQMCLSYIWHQGKRTLVPTLGGNNNDVNTINNDGLVLAVAETKVHGTCVSPQILSYEAFTWVPATGAVHRLSPLKGDFVTEGFAMNDRGDVGGYSGACGNGEGDPYIMNHAVWWRHGKPVALRTLGGTIGNTVFGINNRGQMVGISSLRGNMTVHAVLWENGRITDLGTLPGDHFSTADNISDTGLVLISSCRGIFQKCRAAIWQNGVMTDLNKLVRPGSSLYLVNPNGINNHGAIAGTALDRRTGSEVPFLATLCEPNSATKECTQSAQERAVTGTSAEALSPEKVGQQPRGRRWSDAFRRADPN
jgi:probable HAF family extracellular repeat protein